MKKKCIVILLAFCAMFVVLSITSCGEQPGLQQTLPSQTGEVPASGAGRVEKKRTDKYTATKEAAAPLSETKTQAKDRLIIKTKSVQMEVENVVATKAKIEQVVKHFKGYVSNLYTSSDGLPTPEPLAAGEKGDKIIRATIETKVPAKDLDRFVAEIKKLGNIESEQEQAQDITLEYVDLSARLKNQRAAEERLLEMYNAAKTVEDMIKIEQQLTTVRGEIEALQGQIQFYDQAVAMATVTIEIHEPAEISTPEWRKNFFDALNQAINNFMSVLTGIIALSGSCLALSIPLIFVALVIYLIAINITRRKKQTVKK